MRDYKSFLINVILVNTQTDRQTVFDQLTWMIQPYVFVKILRCFAG